ncbi:MAG: polyhydroxyalkanoate depolymerase [Roseibium sp.]|uniref:polyhydroxyalkanoate depolymerase n=2 Tax=Roseibium sp. TaxID=1936156 RepID=UPI001B0D129A|nr:polyhydroxyalkanoate depolymerase [Roseibium sp.]MBO6894498.1 polyhydroxyalkanoate depolymerase [Roseibium sp.]MBO6932281.1 polyhydroxyalkanoate depolymerase [Roseibium sp.]
MVFKLAKGVGGGLINEGDAPLPFYHLYELNHAAMAPFRAMADMTRLYFQNPLNPLTHTSLGRSVAAGCEVLERTTRRYGKPEFGLKETSVGGVRVPVREEIVWSRAFCDLVRFERGVTSHRNDPKILIVSPMSGHYATLLRGTVETLMPDADVYITDWIDARMVPIQEGKFDLDDYIDYIISMLHFLGPDTHVLGVCQPSVPVLAAVAVMEDRDDPYVPSTMTLMGGPIDTRVAPTAVNDLAVSKGIDWFKSNVVMKVPFPHPGFMRDVYPGFLQLSGFMSMNLDRHVTAHRDFFQHLVEGDGDSAEKHRDFYDEYLAVMDLTAEFYLQTVETVFIDHSLPNGTMVHNGRLVDCSKITRTALLTVEGEKDDITGRGQTKAAHDLCTSLSDEMKVHYEQPNVGHYGVFNGSRWRSEIAPRVMDFIRSNRPGTPKKSAPKKAAAPKAKTKPASNSLEQILLQKPEGAADDLKAISGVGPKLEKVLNEAGIFHYWQIASLKKAQIDALDSKLEFRGRIERDNWIEQARDLSETVS